MSEFQYYVPLQMPSEFSRFEEELTQLPVGTSGKLGALRIRLRRDMEKTVIDDLFCKVPLQTLKALYLDERLPGMAFIFIMNPTGGIVQGDRLRIDLSVGEEAMAHITTQAATKIYRMNRNYATQVINVDVEENGYLEFIPDQTIPYVDSRFYQELNLRVHRKATTFYSEIISPGRLARGENFQYDIYYSKVIGKDQDGGLRFIDAVVLQPKRDNLKSLGVLERWDYLGNTYLLTTKTDVTELSDQIHRSIENMSPHVIGSSSPLPKEDGLVIRLLGRSSISIRQALEDCWGLIRNAILGVPVVRVRKY